MRQRLPVVRIAGGCQHDCPDACSWEVEVEGEVATAIHARADHPYTRGSLCPKVTGYLADRVYDPSRVVHPMRRVGAKGEGTFEAVSWQVAMNDIAGRLRRLIERHGGTAILPFSHQGAMGIVQERSIDRRFFAVLGARRLIRDFCGFTGAEGLAATVGTGHTVLPEQVRHSDLVVLWGTDTVLTNPHLWRLIEDCRRERGTRVVTIDPLLTETALRSDLHLRPLPGGDAALALAVAHILFRDGAIDQQFLQTRTIGWQEFRDHCAGYDLDSLSAIAGVETKQLELFADLYGSKPASVIRIMLGLEKHSNGAMMARAIACLSALTGSWRHVGGGVMGLTNMIHQRALNLDALSRPDLVDEGLPAVHWARLGEALNAQDPLSKVHALVVYLANPATTAPNQDLVVSGLARTDLFTVVHDQRLTDTCRYADYVLPATTMIEHWDLLRSYGHRYVSLNRPAIAPVGESVSTTEFFRKLAAAMGLDRPELFDSDLELIRQALASDDPALHGVTFEMLQEQGWAPLSVDSSRPPYRDAEFRTESGRIELVSAAWERRGLGRLPTPQAPISDSYPLVFLTTHADRKLFNSTYADRPERAGKVNTPLLHLNQQDAVPRGIDTGDEVVVGNDLGDLTVTAQVSSYARPGVVVMSFGRWRSHDANAAVNRLTRDGLTDTGGGTNFRDTRVDVRRAAPPNGQ